MGFGGKWNWWRDGEGELNVCKGYNSGGRGSKWKKLDC